MQLERLAQVTVQLRMQCQLSKCPPKAHKLSEKQVSEMRNWRAMHGQSVPQKTVRNMTTKDNPGTLPINLYAADAPTVQPLDFAVLSEAAAVPVPQREQQRLFTNKARLFVSRLIPAIHLNC